MLEEIIEIPHKQVPVKVTAYVDEGIKELVELLNTFEGIITTSSCQGYPKSNGKNGICGKAHVSMEYYLEEAELSDKYSEAQSKQVCKLAEFGHYIHDAIHKYNYVDNPDPYKPPNLCLSTYIWMEWGDLGCLDGNFDGRLHIGDLSIYTTPECIPELIIAINKYRSSNPWVGLK